MTSSKKMAAILDRAGIGYREVHVIGNLVHVDAYAKYRDKLVDMMNLAGCTLRTERDGVHLSGPDGLRLVFEV